MNRFPDEPTRDAEAVMREFGIESLSSTQVSRAAKLLDGELDAWRNRPLGEIKYLILDARYESEADQASLPVEGSPAERAITGSCGTQLCSRP